MIINNKYDVNDVVKIEAVDGHIIQGTVDSVKVTMGKNNYFSISYTIIPISDKLKRFGSYDVHEENVIPEDDGDKINNIIRNIKAVGGRLIESKPAENIYALRLYPIHTDVNIKQPALRIIERTKRLDCYTAMAQFSIDGDEICSIQ